MPRPLQHREAEAETRFAAGSLLDDLVYEAELLDELHQPETYKQVLIRHQQIPIVVPHLVMEMANKCAIRPAHQSMHLLAFRIVSLSERDVTETRRVGCVVVQ
jgi:hypothetical protein